MFNDTAAGFRVGDVHFLDIYADALDAAFFQFIHQVSSSWPFAPVTRTFMLFPLSVSQFSMTVSQIYTFSRFPYIFS